MPSASLYQKNILLTDILKDVSRAFFLSLNILPQQIRSPIGTAYLLARTADTISDSAKLSPDKRLTQLQNFRSLLHDPKQIGRIPLTDTAQAIPDPSERRLLYHLPGILKLYRSQDEPDRQMIQEIVLTLTKAMEIDLTKFSRAPGRTEEVHSLATEEELETYIYYAAGCVGEFWTKICYSKCHHLHCWNFNAMCKIGIEFGKALQLTNILRDLPKDLACGRCYIPSDQLSALKLQPEELRNPSTLQPVLPILDFWTRRALTYFTSAEQYFYAHPVCCYRLRLACLWPILIGLATLAKLTASPHWLNAKQRIKVSRPWIYTMVFASLPTSTNNTLTGLWINFYRQQIVSNLARRLKQPAQSSNISSNLIS